MGITETNEAWRDRCILVLTCLINAKLKAPESSHIWTAKAIAELTKVCPQFVEGLPAEDRAVVTEAIDLVEEIG